MYTHLVEGDTTALRLCLERIAPPVREHPIQDVELPVIEDAKDLPKFIGRLITLVTQGDIKPSEAEKLTRLVSEYSKVTELADIEERLQTLEQAILNRQSTHDA